MSTAPPSPMDMRQGVAAAPGRQDHQRVHQAGAEQQQGAAQPAAVGGAVGHGGEDPLRHPPDDPPGQQRGAGDDGQRDQGGRPAAPSSTGRLPLARSVNAVTAPVRRRPRRKASSATPLVASATCRAREGSPAPAPGAPLPVPLPVPLPLPSAAGPSVAPSVAPVGGPAGRPAGRPRGGACGAQQLVDQRLACLRVVQCLGQRPRRVRRQGAGLSFARTLALTLALTRTSGPVPRSGPRRCRRRRRRRPGRPG